MIPIPVEDCENGGKRWGKEGKCYHGPDAEKKALAQGRAVEASKHKNAGVGDVNYHIARVKTYQEKKIRSPVEKGVWAIHESDYNGQDRVTSYEFDPELFSEDQAKVWLVAQDIELLWYDPSSKAFETASERIAAKAKALNASGELTYEYLLAFHERVRAHKDVYDHIKDEIFRGARGSAGGQIKAKRAAEGLEDVLSISDEPIKFTNAAPLDAYLSETDEYIDTSVVLAKEGVFRGTDDEPRLKPFDALKASAQWMLGTPITNGHIPGEVLPDTRRIGQIIDVKARPETRDIFGTARFFKNYLTEDELKRLREGSPIDGSIGYRTPVKYDSGNFNGEDYVGIETGPFVLDEYAILPGSKGACSSEKGCGIFQNSAVAESDDMLVLIDGDVRRCPKNKNQSGDIDDMEADELKKILNESIKAAMGPTLGRIEALEKKTNAAPTPLAEDPVIKALTDSVKSLNESMPIISSIKSEQDATKKKMNETPKLTEEIKALNEKFEAKVKAEEAAKEAATKAEFVKMLNAGSLADADKLYGEVKGLNPVEYEAWKKRNAAKLLNEADRKDPKGQKHANSGGDEVTTARAKALETLHKRR